MSTVCACGCEKPAAPGSKYAQNTGKGNCRDRFFAMYHPRLDLSGLDPVAAKRAERMVAEAVRAAKLGQSRATVDADVEVTHGRDERLSCRARLKPAVWSMLDEMLADGWGMEEGSDSRSGIIESLVVKEYLRWKEGR